MLENREEPGVAGAEAEPAAVDGDEEADAEEPEGEESAPAAAAAS